MDRDRVSHIKDILLMLLLGALGFYLVVKYLFPIAAPFLAAWGIAFLTKRPADFISSKLKMPKRISRLLVSLGLILGFGSALVFSVVKLFAEAWQFITDLSASGELERVIAVVLAPLKSIFSILPRELSSGITDALGGVLSRLISEVGGAITTMAGRIPGILFLIIITAISAVYFSCDLENINQTAKSLIPERICTVMVHFKEKTTKIILKYIKSYLLIMLLTFSILLLGLTLLRIRYALLMAFVIAILDILPIIGLGAVLIPWSLWSFAASNSALGIGLIILYGVAVIIRQIAEPKIVGKNLGLNPLLTIILMYIGFALFGVIGLVLVPIGAVALLSGGLFSTVENHSAEIDE